MPACLSVCHVTFRLDVGLIPALQAKWYVGKTPRVECDKAVLAANVGDWLVRMSSNGTMTSTSI